MDIFRVARGISIQPAFMRKDELEILIVATLLLVYSLYPSRLSLAIWHTLIVASIGV